jgi:hypothetical protein
MTPQKRATRAAKAAPARTSTPTPATEGTPKMTATALVRNRNALSGYLVTILHAGTANVAPYTSSARQALATAAVAHNTLVGEDPTDPEYTAGLALVSAAEAFVAACAAAQPVVGSPNNWMPAGSAIASALAGK